MQSTRCCYVNSLREFLNIEGQVWLDIMKDTFEENFKLALSDDQIEAWKDCFVGLKNYLPMLEENLQNFDIVFEYELPFEGGRRPDVLLISQEYVIILEFKMKANYKREDLDQVEAYARDISEYHFESKDRTVIPILVITKNPAKNTMSHNNGVIACPVENLVTVLNNSITSKVTACDSAVWLNSKYEPLPTIVDAARKFMNNEDLPNIKKVNSTGIPEAISELTKLTIEAKKMKKHVLALVTGVPGAGKTFLGLKYVYDICADNNAAESVYLSGNGPLVAVLKDALNNKTFVNDVNKVVRDFQRGRVAEYGKHILVFDEGQRAWDAERMSQWYGEQKSEADVLVEAVDKYLDWSVLLILVGEGQSINTGENGGLRLWSNALANTKSPWTVVCPNKLLPLFKDTPDIMTNDSFNLTVSLRSYLASDVSKFVNCLFSGKFSEAKSLVPGILQAGFKMYLTRDINTAKNYCRDRYKGNTSKRFGLIASSKAKLLSKYKLRPGYHAKEKINVVVKWFNAAPTDARSCCQLREVISEYDCQGLEVDFPIVCWGDDLLYRKEGKWYVRDTNNPGRQLTIEEMRYRVNSYRVLMTRGRDGMIIFLPPEKDFDDTYQMFKDMGMLDLEKEF